MADIVDEDELPQPRPLRRWRGIALAILQFAAPIVSMGCAVLAGYYAHSAVNQKPPADVAALSVSILKSGDSSPEMRDWAENALGIQSDIGMSLKSAGN